VTVVDWVVVGVYWIVDESWIVDSGVGVVVDMEKIEIVLALLLHSGVNDGDRAVDGADFVDIDLDLDVV